ncbi:RNase H domain-containing protein [Trichonephila clavipes]|nr:RNase H domain-containing protein [Trichonephila clavipes]
MFAITVQHMSYKAQLQRTLLHHPLLVGEDSLMYSNLVLAQNRRGAWNVHSSSPTSIMSGGVELTRFTKLTMYPLKNSVIRNPDHGSVFRLELIAVSALDYALNSYDSIWILTDSRSSIQYLKNWPKIMYCTGLDILSILARLCQRKQVCFQWIPSHVGMPGNEAVDELARRGCDHSNPSPTVLNHSEIHSLQRTKINLTWQNPPDHHWYAAKSPGISLQCRSSRAHQTAWKW